MNHVHQLDFFQADAQGELFDEDAAPVAYRPDPEKVRARLHKIIGEARSAAYMPWDRSRAGLYRTIVPQMTLWLPEEEAAQLRLAFEQEWVRLEAA